MKEIIRIQKLLAEAAELATQIEDKVSNVDMGDIAAQIEALSEEVGEAEEDMVGLDVESDEE